MFEQQYQANYDWWDERAKLHPATEMYQHHIQSLRNGGTSLHEPELSEVGDVSGKSLLHLQCHIGTDSLSWVRKGATVTGVDFSESAITQARTLSAKLALPATFVHSNVYDLHERLAGQFDVVFSSYGAIIWLHDLKRWAATITHFLRPGGFFYIADGHPMLMTVDEDLPEGKQTVRLTYPYFEHATPVCFEDGGGSYADPDLPTNSNVTYEWMHSFEEILMSLINAGLTIELFGEHRACPWEALPCCIQGSDRLYRLPDALADRIPLPFSLKARKPL
jgi:SAM-dependent methyltransferase